MYIHYIYIYIYITACSFLGWGPPKTVYISFVCLIQKNCITELTELSAPLQRGMWMSRTQRLQLIMYLFVYLYNLIEQIKCSWKAKHCNFVWDHSPLWGNSLRRSHANLWWTGPTLFVREVRTWSKVKRCASSCEPFGLCSGHAKAVHHYLGHVTWRVWEPVRPQALLSKEHQVRPHPGLQCNNVDP